MMKQLEEDDYLIIKLLSYDRPTPGTERFCFLEMSTLQATTLLPKDIQVVSCHVVAYTDENHYVDDDTTRGFKTIDDFNAFFTTHPDHYIHDCEIELEDGIRLGSHDDGEVSIEFVMDTSDQTIIDDIFQKYRLDRTLIDLLKSKPGHQIAIDRQSNVVGDYETFDDYLRNGRRTD